MEKKNKFCVFCHSQKLINNFKQDGMTCQKCGYTEWGGFTEYLVSKGFVFDNGYEIVYRPDDSLIFVSDDKLNDLFYENIKDFIFSKENMLNIYNSVIKSRILL